MRTEGELEERKGWQRTGRNKHKEERIWKPAASRYYTLETR
jgi:hypothetical protein